MSEDFFSTGANIKAIGVGGGGGNMIAHMLGNGVDNIGLIVANTDAQALGSSHAPIKVQLGEQTTRGLGAGMKPEIGRVSAEESYNDIKDALAGSDMVFVAAGLGGGTGTGAAAVVAQAAKEIGALTVAIVTKPFAFEGPKRKRFADEAIAQLRQVTDSIVIIPNDKLLSIVNKNMGIKESFEIVDNVLTQAVTGISGVILKHGATDINLDFADLRTVMSHKGLALMGIGQAEGSDAAFEAIKSAIDSPLFDNTSINGSMGILVHFNIHPNHPLSAINQAMSVVYESADPDADVIFGTTTDDTIPADRVMVTIIATGFEKEEMQAVNKTAETSLKVSAPKIIRVSGGYDLTDDEEVLNIPTFLRRQQD